MIEIFQGVMLYNIKQARKHAAKDQAGMPVKPGLYCQKKLNDAQINHFLDFLHGAVMQDVASGTHSAKRFSGRKSNIPNAVRTYQCLYQRRVYKQNRSSIRKNIVEHFE